MEKVAELTQEYETKPVKVLDLNHVDFFRLRSAALGIVEELKLRQRNDAENEGKIRHLVKEKYELERKFENETAKIDNLQEQHSKMIQDVKRKFEEKLHLLTEEVKQHQIHKECSEKEAKALKDEVHSLQLANYSLEKRLREQEHKLLLQTNSLEQHLSQFSALEHKGQNLSVMCQDLSDSQNHLEKNVLEAVKLNRTLTYVNDHQKCDIEQQKSSIAALQDQILHLNVQIQSQPVQTSQIRLEQEIAVLQQQISAGESMKEALAKEVGEYKEKYEANVKSLNEAHSLIERHLQRAEIHESEAAAVKKQLTLTENTVSELKGGLDQANKDLDLEKNQFQHALDKWKGEEEKMMAELRLLQVQLAETKKAETELENLNSDWSKQNMELHQQLILLKEKLEIEKKEEITQTVLEMLNTKGEFCQTEIQTSVSESQTDALGTSSFSTQTPSASYSNRACQTHKVELLNQELQTVDTRKDDCYTQTIQTSETVDDSTQTHVESPDNKDGRSVHESPVSSRCNISFPVPCATSSPNVLYTTAPEEPDADMSVTSDSHLDEKIKTDSECFGGSREKKSRMSIQMDVDHDSKNRRFSNMVKSQPITPFSSCSYSEPESSCKNNQSEQNMNTVSQHIKQIHSQCQQTSQYSLHAVQNELQKAQHCSQQCQQKQQPAKPSLSRMSSTEGSSEKGQLCHRTLASSQETLKSGHYDDHAVDNLSQNSAAIPTDVNTKETGIEKRVTFEGVQPLMTTPKRVFNPLQVVQGSFVKPEQSPNTEIRKRLELVSLSHSDSSSCGPNSTMSSFSATESMLSSNISSLNEVTSDSSYHTAQSIMSSDSSFYSRGKLASQTFPRKTTNDKGLGYSTSDASVISPTPQLSPYSHYASLLKKVRPPTSRKSLSIGLATKFSSAEMSNKVSAEISVKIQTDHVSDDLHEDTTGKTAGLSSGKKSILKGNKNRKESSSKSVRFAEHSANVKKDNRDNQPLSIISKSVQDSGEQSLFSDGEEESIELGSQLQKIEATLQVDKISKGRKRKHYDKH